jgi:hypothetical protein
VVRLRNPMVKRSRSRGWERYHGSSSERWRFTGASVGAFGKVQVMDWGLAKAWPRGGAVDDASAGRSGAHETVVATAWSGGADSDRMSATASAWVARCETGAKRVQPPRSCRFPGPAASAAGSMATIHEVADVQ